MTLTIRDVILVMAGVASIVTAWGLYGTRLSVVEEKLVSIGNNIVEVRQLIKDIKSDHRLINKATDDELKGLEERLREIEEQQAQIKVIIKHRK